ncbi:TIGR01621 family pseudouridine synthase [Aliiglaciecola sp. LCG003]|uniref:TIGR01621 family pseudouridine synthase n=1 Tax=Aliiglaciecola sp. LCG003 TaxID=3053655 RepID=UPI0025744133|nr:TIGR01621 family pseudouridine synthase [Aliiglaciecola sp. LCG003]WJG08319.1 TIGR01621 family pseudouridine synthase [Aliiglaciecola sp. LCG003]
MISIAYQADDFVIINKPAGIPVQREAETEGVLTLMQSQLNLERLWLVHRLDKVTSGLLILATTEAAASRLSQLFAKREIQKYYLAVSNKKPKKSQGTVTGDMHKVRDGKWALQHSQHNPATSQFFNCGLTDGLRLFVIKPYTGKTHQIRVMMKSLGSPILGDTHYSGTFSDRAYLHAYALEFEDNGTLLRVTCMPETGEFFQPNCISNIADKFLSPWLLDWPKLKIATARQ